ncbi:MAG: hypothetical protein ACOC1F_05460 [Myxococcota bacterium]
MQTKLVLFLALAILTVACSSDDEPTKTSSPPDAATESGTDAADAAADGTADAAADGTADAAAEASGEDAACEPPGAPCDESTNCCNGCVMMGGSSGSCT